MYGPPRAYKEKLQVEISLPQIYPASADGIERTSCARRAALSRFAPSWVLSIF